MTHLKIVHMTSGHEAFDTRIAAKQCSSLAALGHDVTLVVREPLEEYTPPPGVRLLTVPRPKNRVARFTQTARAVAAVARAESPDIFHFHDPELMPWGLKLARAGLAVVYDVHEDYRASMLNRDWIPGPLRKLASRAVAALETRLGRKAWIAAATPEIAAYFPPERTALVQNFPTLAEFDTPTPLAERLPRIVYVGAVTEERGVTDIIAALPQVVAAHPNVGFDLIGDASDALLAQMRTMEGWRHLTYHGRQGRPEVSRLLRQARVGIVTLRDLPRYRVSQPTKLYEYMAAGTAFLASDFPLWKAQVGNAAGRFCIPEPDHVASALTKMLAEPDALSIMGEEGRSLVERSFSWEADLSRLVQLYEKAHGA